MSYPANEVGQSSSRPNSISSYLEGFDAFAMRLDNFGDRLSKVADRISGPRPRQAIEGGASTLGGSPIPTPLVHALREKGNVLVRILDRLERELTIVEEGL